MQDSKFSKEIKLSRTDGADSPGKRIAVLGGRGMLGQDLLTCLRRSGFQPLCLDLAEIDITDRASVRSSFQQLAPVLAVNCAAYTAVDKAETEPERAFRINRDGAENLASVCAARRIPLVHISTDYVFDGSIRRPYTESDPPNPLSVYGTGKWQGEEAVREHLVEHIIVRTAWLYGVHGQNFAKTILRLAGEREEIRVVADQYGCPTWTMDLADAVTTIAKRLLQCEPSGPWGTYHFCGAGTTTWYEFALAIVEEGARRRRLKVTRIRPITTAEYPTAARRPRWSVLDCTRIESVFSIIPMDWRIAFSKMMAELDSTGDALTSAQ